MNLPRWLESEWPLIAALAVAILALPENYSVQVATLVVYCLLALGLNVVVGNTGLLHLGIAAFFGIGAYATGILASSSMPFGWNYFAVLFLAGLLAAAAGVALGAPTLQLRGDYLALVTLGFGEVVRISLKNLDSITNGTAGIGQVRAFSDVVIDHGIAILPTFPTSFTIPRSLIASFFCLGCLAVAVFVLRNLERSRLGRAWVAIREDELAASCMGLDVPQLKLTAFACGAFLAGLAGSLYVVLQGNTGSPESYGFARSIITLAAIILGGLGSMRGAILGIVLLAGFDSILTPAVDLQLQQILPDVLRQSEWCKLVSWRYIIFGLALVLTMRLRPEGIFPSKRMQLELHEHEHSGKSEPQPSVTQKPPKEGK